MTDITKPNEHDPDQLDLIESTATLYAVVDLFERMGHTASALYTALEAIRYNDDRSTWRQLHSYDNFRIEDGCIVLVGSYYDRCDGTQEHEVFVSVENFYSPTYLDKVTAKSVRLQAERQAAKDREAADLAARHEAADRAMYAQLQAKFGESV